MRILSSVFPLGLLVATLSAEALFVQKPCCSAFPHAGASFGPQLPWTSPGVFGILSRSQDKDCQGAVPGTIVLVDRGLEQFVDAVLACQEKGVMGVVVRNVASTGGSENDLIVMGSPHKDTGVKIPSVFVSRKTGDELDAMLALEPTVFVELFAADDVNSLMAYVAYLVMSVETLFFGVLFMLIVLVVGTRRVSSPRRCCRRSCRKSDDRSALIVNDRALLEPLQPNSIRVPFADSADLESKLRPDRAILSYPVVFANGIQEQHSVSLPVSDDEPVFEQQEQ